MDDTSDQSDRQSIEVTRDDDTDEYYVHIDGEKHGPVDPEDLREVGNNLYLHFVVFPSTPPYDPEEHDVPDEVETTEVEDLPAPSDEEIDELIEDDLEELEDEDT